MPILPPTRIPKLFVFSDVAHARSQADTFLSNGQWHNFFDLIEQVVMEFPAEAVFFLAQAYDVYATLPDKSRYGLYVSRHFDFGIHPGDKVLDLGSGHNPFPLATHLADIALNDHHYGRGGVPFHHVDGKPTYECSVEKTPFKDKEFDFVYCSHVLEHASDPEAACAELVRIGKRGYIETPSRGKDTFLGGAKVSNHKWALELHNGVLFFTEYTPQDVVGLGNNILQQMHSAPQNIREKAFSALLYLRSLQINTMLLWEDSFPVKVRRLFFDCGAQASSFVGNGFDRIMSPDRETMSPTSSLLTKLGTLFKPKRIL